jgi:hypothetical protein
LGPERASVLDGVDVRFPYYGDLLDRFTREMRDDLPADILVRGVAQPPDRRYRDFEHDVAQALQRKLNLSDDVVASYGNQEIDVVERGVLNWGWVQAIMRAADAIPGVSAGAISLALHDVYMYLSRSRVRADINKVVHDDMPSGRCVVVAHSLGSVVAYDVLRTMETVPEVPLFVTVGSPLAVGPIKRGLVPLTFPAGVARWFNAYDDRDVVALEPLTSKVFPVTPPVVDHGAVQNRTENAHGITGYLDDPQVAEEIFKALS